MLDDGPGPVRERVGIWPRLMRHLLLRGVTLPAAVTTALVQRDLPIRMSDDTVLLADHWAPADHASGNTVLIRSPYGRTATDPTARMLAERGHHVLVQSCRGTFGSGGVWNPFFAERSDGADTVAWLRDQPWYGGRFVTSGPSYLGLTQWAIAEDRPPDLRGMVVVISARSFRDGKIYPGEGFDMESALSWHLALATQELGLPRRVWGLLRAKRRLAAGTDQVPEKADLTAIGRVVPAYRDWLAHNAPGDPWWDPVNFCADPVGLPAMVLVGGWQDVFLVEQVADFKALRGAGVPVRLIVGPWRHTDTGPAKTGLQALFDLLGSLDRDSDAAAEGSGDPAVRLHLSGTPTVLDLDNWPAPDGTSSRLYLHGDGRLASSAPTFARSGTVRYDPADPTPSAGGRGLNPFTAGVRKQAVRESRADVLTFTSEPLATAMTVVGEPMVQLRVQTSAPTFDLFVRLCEVDVKGVSRTVSDDYCRLPGAADPIDVTVTLAPTGHVFAAGHLLRLQVSGGAHPLYLRNPGTADPLHDFSQLVPWEFTVDLGPDHPAVLQLPQL